MPNQESLTDVILGVILALLGIVLHPVPDCRNGKHTAVYYSAQEVQHRLAQQGLQDGKRTGFQQCHVHPSPSALEALPPLGLLLPHPLCSERL